VFMLQSEGETRRRHSGCKRRRASSWVGWRHYPIKETMGAPRGESAVETDPNFCNFRQSVVRSERSAQPLPARWEIEAFLLKAVSNDRPFRRIPRQLRFRPEGPAGDKSRPVPACSFLLNFTDLVQVLQLQVRPLRKQGRRYWLLLGQTELFSVFVEVPHRRVSFRIKCHVVCNVCCWSHLH
jgi:hypothetical protein